MEYTNKYKSHLKVRLYEYTIVYTNKCTLHVTYGNEHLTIKEGCIAFFEKHIEINISIIKRTNTETNPFEVISINNDLLSKVLTIMDPIYSFSFGQMQRKRRLQQRIFMIDGDIISTEIFKSIKSMKVCNEKVYKLACLFSIVDNECDFFSSICVSTSISFTDKVKKIIECDFEKKWKLSDISEEMNMSEVAVRKNLENENITFQQVLLDSKMNYAAKLILNSKNHINNVSNLIGMSSTSYFIKLFNSYYGVTPKKFYFYHKSS